MSFARKVRDVIRENFMDREFTANDIAPYFDLVFRDEKQPLYFALRDLKNRGVLIRVRTGVYKIAAQTAIKPAEKQAKMWRLLRSMRTATVDDMVAMAGVQAGYAKEFFQSLARQGIVRRIDSPTGNKPAKYQMIADPVKMPQNEKKLARLRAIRAAKKSTEKAIDQAAESMIGATKALAKLKTALGDIPEDDHAEL
jgi:ribosomal protein S25